jgi:membrane associated rhomboid family serine protease
MAQPAIATKLLLAIMAAVQVVAMMGGGSAGVDLGSSNRLARDWALFGPFVRDGEWYRLLTAGFLHYGLIHILFNGFALWNLGQTLESLLGKGRFLGLFIVAVLGGSAGALLFSPTALTAGASGGVFGVMAAGLIATQRAGIPFNASGFGPTLVMNIIITFTIPGISIGGHGGGAVAGALAGFVLFRQLRKRNDVRHDAAALIGLGVLFVALGIAFSFR